MHQRRGLQRVRRALALKVMVGKAVQLVVEKRDQGVERLAVTCFPLFDQFTYGLGQLGHVTWT